MKNQFTFHYGSIQIRWTRKNVDSYRPFTFHYGSIQICWNRMEYYSSKVIYIPLWFYSNYHVILVIIYKKKFTFHYGSIQIESINTSLIINAIYIPLWFYSNNFWSNNNAKSSHIYIPLWFYSNLCSEQLERVNWWDLHSTMVLFKL